MKRTFFAGSVAAAATLAAGTAALLALLAIATTVTPATAQNASPAGRPAPELVTAGAGASAWLNVPANAAPPTLAARKGKVTIVHFWTFG